MSAKAPNEGTPTPKEGVVHVYAIETTQTNSDRVTDGGTAYSTKLDQPVTRTDYLWQGKILNRPAAEQGSSNARASVHQLAENFGDIYRRSLGGAAQSPQGPQYTLDFSLPTNATEMAKSRGGVGAKVRELTEEEQRAFIAAFQQANRKATDTK